MNDRLAANLAEIKRRIAVAARASGRDADEIKLIAVSKTHPAATLSEAIEAGATIFGENKVQEAEEKILEIGRDSAEWHLIGHLQSNKARRAVQLFDCVHTLDSIELAMRLERICQEENRSSLDVLIQVDLGQEATKNGIDETDLPALVDCLKSCERLNFSGLMTIPPFFDDAEMARPFFSRLREIRDRVLPSGELSMGMSGDFEIAVEEGATLVRVGTAIFGGARLNKKFEIYKTMLSTVYPIIQQIVIYTMLAFVAALVLRLIFNYSDPNPFGKWGRFSYKLKKATDRFVYPAARLLAQFRIDTRLAPAITILIAVVLAYFVLQIVNNAFFVIDGLTQAVAVGNVRAIVGLILYALLSVYILFIFIRFLSSWFVFTRNTFLGFVQRVTDPVLIPARRIIPTVGIFDISTMIVLILLGFLQTFVLRALVY